MSGEYDRLAKTARRALGAEGLIVVVETPEGPRIAGRSGLEPRAIDAVAPGLGAGEEAILRRHYEGVLSGEAVHDGVRLGAVHALRRSSDAFDNPQLVHTFAAQLALTVALRRRPPMVDDRLQTWALLDQLVLSANSLGELSRALDEVIGPLFGGARTGVMAADPQRNMLQTLPGAFGVLDGTAAASHRVSFFDSYSNSARVLTTGCAYLSNATDGDASIRQQYADVFSVQRLLTVPLRDVGVLHIANGAEPFDLDDLERAHALAPRVASILELSTKLFQLRRQQRLEETLAAVAVAVASGDAADDFVPPALQELCAAIEAGLVAFLPDDGPVVVARCDVVDPMMEEAVLEEAGSDPGVRAYVVGPQRAGDPGWAAFYVPVLLGEMRVGTLAALRTRGEPFTLAERRSLTRMANLAALARGAERYQQQRAELARLQERQRIADDLHDDVAQILFAAQLALDSLMHSETLDPAITDQLVRTRGLLIRGDKAIRTVIHRLSAPPAADLAARLGGVVCSLEDEFSMAIRLEIAEEASAAARGLRRPAVEALLKVAREALVNVAKHAGPCNVRVRLAVLEREQLQLDVCDDGHAVPHASASPVHHGLGSLRRVIDDQDGTLRMTHGATGGTTVTATIPLRHDEEGGLAETTVPGALSPV
ncbi:MAG: hypothetical protein JWO90_442 [Solirubrobacterales bacterium]|jgi:signal transduction histidine kinase|nr:hypothetical protein [Solirubrobacterales bacterium]